MVSGDNRLRVKLTPTSSSPPCSVRSSCPSAPTSPSASALRPDQPPRGVGAMSCPDRRRASELSLCHQAVQLNEPDLLHLQGHVPGRTPGHGPLPELPVVPQRPRGRTRLHQALHRRRHERRVPRRAQHRRRGAGRRQIPLHPLRWTVDEPDARHRSHDPDYVPDVVRWLMAPGLPERARRCRRPALHGHQPRRLPRPHLHPRAAGHDRRTAARSTTSIVDELRTMVGL